MNDLEQNVIVGTLTFFENSATTNSCCDDSLSECDEDY